SIMTERTDQTSDSAGSDHLRAALHQQGVLLGSQATQLNAARREVEGLNTQVADLMLQVTELWQAVGSGGLSSPAIHGNFPEPHANSPPLYNGDPNSCRSFLAQCALVFPLQAHRYAAEEARIAFVLTLLTGRAREWGVAVWENQASCCHSFRAFREEMTALFNRSARGDEAATQLSQLSQGRTSITDYSIRFRTLAAACLWNPEALRARFLDGLCAAIKDEIAILDLPRDLEEVINLCLRVETQLTARRHRRLSPSSWRAPAVPSVGFPPAPPDEEPMQLGRSRLTPHQKQHWLLQGLCLYCGAPGHQAILCPVKAVRVGTISTSSPTPRTLLPFRLNFKGGSHTGKALIDSGAEGNFLDAATAHRWRIPTLPLTQPKGCLDASGCHVPCLGPAPSVVPLSLLQTKAADLVRVPEEYLDLGAVFSKTRASSLPPHRRYNCAIDLLPGTSPPRGRLYSLSGPERETMDKYMHESLQAGLIRPSSSPACVGFFFTEWPVPDSGKALQRFLGFANFYRRFIRGFGQVAAPLTPLTSTKIAFKWNPHAQVAFDDLKSRFISAPVLCFPDPKQQFIVEVNASAVGVGAVLSQCSELDGKVHPCAFFFHRLSRAERNYDIGNRELLGVRLALGEWCHWLEGSAQPFLVWTDHKNLEYVRSAKRLSSRQARWALFFDRFNFTLSYRPESKNAG
ncbi:hypothetical protein M9458_021139, partial [Cirrhinus mrigala]